MVGASSKQVKIDFEFSNHLFVVQHVDMDELLPDFVLGGLDGIYMPDLPLHLQSLTLATSRANPLGFSSSSSSPSLILRPSLCCFYRLVRSGCIA